MYVGTLKAVKMGVPYCVIYQELPVTHHNTLIHPFLKLYLTNAGRLYCELLLARNFFGFLTGERHTQRNNRPLRQLVEVAYVNLSLAY
jgi:hypothetical protein